MSCTGDQASELNMVLESLQAFMRYRPSLVVGTGLSMSMGLPGMAELQAHLSKAIPPMCRDDRIRAEWDACSAHIAQNGLEAGLLEAPAHQELLGLIVRQTASFVRERDLRLRQRVFLQNEDFPFARLMRHMTNSLASGGPVLDVITPNYDRVVEYACDLNHIECCTGFTGSEVLSFDPRALSTDYYLQAIDGNHGKPTLVYRKCHKVRLLKPHGSLGWQRLGEKVYQCSDCLPGSTPVLITPGTTKYEYSLTDSVMNAHREVANSALKSAEAILVIGYGFNDAHLQTVLLERISDGTPCLILTKYLTAKARTVAASNDHVMAVEAGGVDTEAVFHMRGESIKVSIPLWSVEGFVKSVI